MGQELTREVLEGWPISLSAFAFARERKGKGNRVGSDDTICLENVDAI